MKDAREVEALWSKLFWATHGTAVGAITSLALAAVDTALWDLRCKAAGTTALAAGGRRTGSGFRSTTPKAAGSSCRSTSLSPGRNHRSRSGWPGVKIKVGKPDANEDVARLRAVREAIGPSIASDGRREPVLTAAEAKRRARLFEPLDLFWFEEPLPAEDITGHARARGRQRACRLRSARVSIRLSHFREYLAAGACGIVQVDVARIGGITPWLKTAHLAEAFNVKVAPHFLMELHVSLAAAVPNALYVEHIPQLHR